MPIEEDIKDVVYEDMVDASPGSLHGDEGLVGLPLSFALEDKKFEENRFEDLFTINIVAIDMMKWTFLMMILNGCGILELCWTAHI